MFQRGALLFLRHSSCRCSKPGHFIFFNKGAQLSFTFYAELLPIVCQMILGGWALKEVIIETLLLKVQGLYHLTFQCCAEA